MRVMLCGATGMVGRNVLEHPRARTLEILAPHRRELNLRNMAQAKQYLQSNKVDAVVHCAGTVGGIQANMNAPVAYLLDNTDIARNLIMAAFESGVPRLLNLGSSCMYPRNRSGKLTEEMLLDGPLEPTNEGYAIAKVFAAKLCQFLSREHRGLHYKTLLPCNLYGRWDHFHCGPRSHLIAAVFDKVASAQRQGESTVSIWGSGVARREFMYAAELADAIFWALDNIEVVPDLLNIGTGIDYTITEYYHAVADVFGYSGQFIYDTTKPEGMTRKLLDVSKATALGWRCNTNLQEGIRKTYEFYCAEHQLGIPAGE